MKYKKHTKIFQRKTLRLRDDHTWKAPDGYKIVVLDRGALSFNIPESWSLTKMEPLEIHDQPPPDDNTRLSVSFWRLPPGVDWTGLPLAQMLSDAMKGSELEILARSEMVTSPRTDMELVWVEHRFLDPQEKREAFSRFALVRGWDVQALFTLDFWVDDAEKLQPVWDEVLRSIQLGRYIEDPTKGVVMN